MNAGDMLQMVEQLPLVEIIVEYAQICHLAGAVYSVGMNGGSLLYRRYER